MYYTLRGKRISYWIQLAGGGNRIVMTNLRFLPNIKTRDEAKNIVFFTGEN